MFEVKAVVRPELVEKVLDELRAIPELPGILVSPARAFGRLVSASGAPRNESAEVMMAVLEVVVGADLIERLTETISTAARTGHHGDGKIFVVPVQDVIRIRTGEHGRGAL